MSEWTPLTCMESPFGAYHFCTVTFAALFLPQLEENLRGLDAELEKLSALQGRRNVRFRESIEKTDK